MAKTPVAFLVFNRPQQTRRVFDAIAAAKPERLLVVADGPRNEAEAEACRQVREIATAVTWPCKVETLFSEVNLGCRKRVASGLDWVFERCEEAIILEDDTLPSSSFFPFCEELLNRYRADERILTIGGVNVMGDRDQSPFSYRFGEPRHQYRIWSGRHSYRGCEFLDCQPPRGGTWGARSSPGSGPGFAARRSHLQRVPRRGRLPAEPFPGPSNRALGPSRIGSRDKRSSIGAWIERLTRSFSNMLNTLREWKLFCLDRPKWRYRREVARLRAEPRYVSGTSDLTGEELEYVDALSFFNIYYEVFKRGIYRFHSEKTAPTILDCGANIGLSVLYFKRLFPDANIVAFEPDPDVFGVLERNVARAGLSAVQLEKSAVWTCRGELTFMREGADGGRVTAIDPASARQVVKAVRLLDYLDRDVDLLKIDIEGAELEVLQDCAEGLGKVKALFVEYHSFEGTEQRLPELLLTLRNAGFRVFCDQPNHVQQPLWEIRPYLGMDFQLNIYAFRK